MQEKRNLKERIKINDLSAFEELALTAIPILIMLAMLLGAYLIVWW